MRKLICFHRVRDLILGLGTKRWVDIKVIGKVLPSFTLCPTPCPSFIPYFKKVFLLPTSSMSVFFFKNENLKCTLIFLLI
jgi:hypothetical protein